MAQDQEQIVPADYPELKQLVWSRNAARPISGEEALSFYERNWRFINQDQLTPEEAALIRRLAERYGNGHLLTH